MNKSRIYPAFCFGLINIQFKYFSLRGMLFSAISFNYFNH